MALSDSATNSLAGLWGSYDFYLISDGHFKNASDMVERFLDRSAFEKIRRQSLSTLASTLIDLCLLVTDLCLRREKGAVPLHGRGLDRFDCCPCLAEVDSK
jgi:hypothetical protein